MEKRCFSFIKNFRGRYDSYEPCLPLFGTICLPTAPI